jgi:hypothetical protein
MENTDSTKIFDLEAHVVDIVEQYRKEAYAFVEEMMWNAFTEIGQAILECERESNGDDPESAMYFAREYTYVMSVRKIAGLSSRTLHEIVRIAHSGSDYAKVPTDKKSGFLLDFLKARTLSFDATRALYPNYLRPWSEKDDQELIRMHGEGESFKKMAHYFGRNEGAVRARVEKLLISKEE